MINFDLSVRHLKENQYPCAAATSYMLYNSNVFKASCYKHEKFTDRDINGIE